LLKIDITEATGTLVEKVPILSPKNWLFLFQQPAGVANRKTPEITMELGAEVALLGSLTPLLWGRRTNGQRKRGAEHRFIVYQGGRWGYRHYTIRCSFN